MTNYRASGSRDDPIQTEGDRGFVGVNMRDDPSMLQSGFAAAAINKDFSRSIAETRRGFRTQPWGQEMGVDFPIDFDFDFHATGFQQPFGAAVFSNPYGDEGALVATRYGAYKLKQNAVPGAIPLPTSERISTRVRMVQCFDRVLMFRGPDFTPLVWNPLEDFSTGLGAWEYIDQSETRNTDADNSWGDGATLIPNVSDGTCFNNRVFLPYLRDQIIVSDILDYTRYNPITQRLKINDGSDDQLMKIVPWNLTTLLAFKDQSIYLLEGVHGNLGSLSSAILTRERGLISTDGWATIGNDVWYWSEGGIFSITQTAQAELQAGADPISAPVQEIVDRINWRYADKIVMHSYSHRVLSAIPIDGADHNNAILSFNRLTGNFDGYWTADFLDILDFVQQDYAGRRQLFALNNTNLATSGTKGAYYLLLSGLSDDLYGVEKEIQDELWTRGYRMGVPDVKRGTRIRIHQSTWRPSFSVIANSEGVNETQTLAAAQTKDRTKYYAHGAAAYDVDNPNDDAAARGREDYSVDMDPADALDLGANGVDPQFLQEVTEAYRYRRHGAYIQVKIPNTQGLCNQHSIAVEAMAGPRKEGTTP